MQLSSCLQTFDFDFFAISGLLCNLTGEYQIEFNVTCRGEPEACPLRENQIVLFSFSLISPPLCSPVLLDIEVLFTPSLSSVSSIF